MSYFPRNLLHNILHYTDNYKILTGPTYSCDIMNFVLAATTNIYVYMYHSGPLHGPVLSVPLSQLHHTLAHIVPAIRRFVHEAPLHAGGKASPSTTSKSRLLNLVKNPVGTLQENLFGLVIVTLAKHKYIA